MPSSSRHNFLLLLQQLQHAALAMALLCVLTGSGSPVGEMMMRSAGEEPSGEQQEDQGTPPPPDALSASPFWAALISSTERHEKQFEDEFQSNAKYHFLENYNLPSFPAGCPSTNFSKENCLKRLVQGLLKYKVLLKHVETEYPKNPILPDARFYGDLLTSLIKNKMKRPDQVAELSASQEQQLLVELSSPARTTAFSRKMTAHAILRHIHLFLIDGQRALSRKEMRAARYRPASTFPLL